MRDKIIQTHDLTKIFTYKPSERGYTLVNALINYMKRKREKLVAVDHVTLNIYRGEFVGLLGPNGAGKTTFIKLLCTILAPDEGTATIDGYDLVKEPERIRRRVNLVPSGGWVGFDWGLTLRENLEFFSILYGLPPELAKKRIDEAFEIVGLSEHAESYPEQLSSGMRQKLVLAKGFLVRTPIIFLDEPTVGLDPESARNIRYFLKQELWKKYGVTILMTTHYIQEAEQLCERVAIMDKGEIISYDSPKNLKKRAGKDTIVEIGAYNICPDLPSRLREIARVRAASYTVNNPTIAGGFVRVHLVDYDATMPQVIKALENALCRIRYVKVSEPTLEDVYLKLTGKVLAT